MSVGSSILAPLCGQSCGTHLLPCRFPSWQIAHWILTHNTTLNLKGIAAGNACWGGSANSVDCNGPNEDRNDVRLFYGKALISKKLHDATAAACKWDAVAPAVTLATSDADHCHELIKEVHEVVGPHNIYNLYDNCPGAAAAAEDVALGQEAPSALELKQRLRNRLLPGQSHGAPISWPPQSSPHSADTLEPAAAVAAPPVTKTGGYAWSCGGMSATAAWIGRADVRAALHLKDASGSRFSYKTSGPASITLWPFLARHIRVLIYNGDADVPPAAVHSRAVPPAAAQPSPLPPIPARCRPPTTADLDPGPCCVRRLYGQPPPIPTSASPRAPPQACVPYIGNEEWISELETGGALSEKEPWRPWYAAGGGKLAFKPPAGYVTTYTVAGAPGLDFSFATIRLAGHMVHQLLPPVGQACTPCRHSRLLSRRATARVCCSCRARRARRARRALACERARVRGPACGRVRVLAGIYRTCS